MSDGVYLIATISSGGEVLHIDIVSERHPTTTGHRETWQAELFSIRPSHLPYNERFEYGCARIIEMIAATPALARLWKHYGPGGAQRRVR